jgi:DNA-binding MarR family transcriptional regulator
VTRVQPAAGMDIADALERLAVAMVGLTTLALNKASPEHDLTFPQWRALLIIGEAADGLRIGEIAARLGVTLPATGRLIRRLERRGLVALAPDAADRRATRARLTVLGDDVRREIVGYRRAAIVEIAGRLGLDGDPRARGLLRLLADAFGAYR